MFQPVVLATCLLGLIIGSYTDLRTREVPDWINYALMTAGFGFALIASIIEWSIVPFVRSLLGFGIFLAFALLMYYTGQWGGGDSKMIMGIGALVGFSIPTIPGLLFDTPFIVLFLVYSMVIGAAYGLVWSAVLALMNRARFRKEFIALQKDRRIARAKLALIAAVLAIIISSFFIPGFSKILMLIMALLIVLTFYLFMFVKVVEKTCMLKHVEPEKLTEGDWIAEEVRVKGRLITGPKDLGIQKHQIAQLIDLKRHGKIDTVLIKEGIPFVPSFLFAFIACLIVGNTPLLLFLH